VTRSVNPSIIIRHPTLEEIEDIGDILFDAFKDKFSFIFRGDLAFGRYVFRKNFRDYAKPEDLLRMLVAVQDREILGAVDVYFKTSLGFRNGFLEIFVSLWRRGGFIRALRQIIGLLNFRINPVDKMTAYISTVGIKSEYQNQKIGEKLMRAAEEMALQRGCRYLSLYVITRNKRAIHLYRKLGFETIYVMKSPLFLRLNGFYGTVYMKKEIGENEPAI
jgi:ribosomal protein S18 acetylase RimI-like enzyme